ncbi:MAG: LptF/LptG family permease [bacterium]|nr:LptF/LptG family permease [bacterium]
MKLIHRITFIDLMSAVAEGVVLFTFVFLLRRLFNITELLVAGGASMNTTLEMVFSMLPSIMLLTMPMAALLATMMVYGRMVQENEFMALRAVGYSPVQLLAPALVLGVLMMGLLGWWGHRIAPKGLRIVREIAADVLRNAATAGIRPSNFSTMGKLIFSASAVENGHMKNLRIFEEREDRIAGVISSPSGYLEYRPDDSSFLFHLQNGRLHQAPSPNRDVVIHFNEMEFSIGIPTLLNKFAKTGPEEQHFSREELDSTAKSYLEAYQIEQSDQGKRAWYLKKGMQMKMEVSRRFSLPAAAFIMAIIGALLGMQSGYGKRSSCYTTTIAVIFLYYLLLNFGRTYVEKGELAPWLGMWIPNYLSMVFAALLLYRFRKI